MNESIPAISPLHLLTYTTKTVRPADFFGILTLLLGCLAGLFVPLMLFGQVAAARTTQTPTSLATLLPGMVVYGLLAVALIWLGIGSIQARRWARALLLIFSWSWLLLGIVMLIVMGFVMPKIMANLPATAGQPAMPPGATGVVMVVMFLFLGFFFIVLPAVWTFFTKPARESHLRNARSRAALDQCLSAARAGALPVAAVLRADDAADAAHGPWRDALLWHVPFGHAGFAVLSGRGRAVVLCRVAAVSPQTARLVADPDCHGRVHHVRPRDLRAPRRAGNVSAHGLSPGAD